MRLSELSTGSGVPVETIKYYLREGLLHRGVPLSASRAAYDDSHVRRLRLIRSLVVGAGLGIAAVRELLVAADAPAVSRCASLRISHRATAGRAGESSDLTRVDGLIERWGWTADDCGRTDRTAVAQALAGLEAAGVSVPVDVLDRYARAVRELASAEAAGLAGLSPAAAARYLVVGTALVGPLLTALRKMAQHSES